VAAAASRRNAPEAAVSAPNAPGTQRVLACMDREDFLWIVGSVANLFRIPFDPRLIDREYPPPCTRYALETALRGIGLQTGWADCAALQRRAQRFPLPAVALSVRNGVPGIEAARPALLVKADESRILYFRSGSTAAQSLPVADLATEFESLLFVSRAAQNEESTPDAELESQPRAFGFRWFIPELRKHKAIWRDVLAASLLIQLIGLTTPLFTQVIIDKVVVHQTQSTLIVVGCGLVMFMLFNAVMSWLRQYLVNHTGNRLDAVLGTEVFRRLIRLPLPYFERRPTGTLVARLQGVETIRAFVTGAAVSLVLDLPFLLIFLAVMFAYSWQLSLIAVGILSLITVLSLVVSPVLREKLNQQFMLGARNQAFLTEYIAGTETVKSLQMEPTLEQRYGDYLATYLVAGFSTRQLSNTYNVIAHALEQTLILSILIVGALLVMENDGFTIGMLVAFQMFSSRMTQPVLRLVGLWQEFQQANIAVKRLGDIMNAPAEPYSLIPRRARTGGGRIDLVNLSFRYGDEHPWLYRDLNYTFEPGTLTLIMGPSGCGKSTLAKLLQGFYLATDGQIRIDGTDLRHLSANELRGLFGVVPQETRLFSGTLYDNLLLANPNATFEDVVSACEAAEIHDFIQALPQGYQTPIGEAGAGLSGGQKQRIAIARALLKKPRILVFDEATSSVDVQTAEALAHTVMALKGERTILFISHTQPYGLIPDARFQLDTSEVQFERDLGPENVNESE
jgi:subfamily B ATP-binding cassette protein HlyB/CyaB